MAHAIHHQPWLPRRDALLGAGSAVALHALAAWLLLHQPPRPPPLPTPPPAPANPH
jgi:hypothetical protein